MTVPAAPYRGIQPFRYVDHAIFLAREEETEELADLVTIHRGVLLYGASGDGKSSLINAGLLPAVARRRPHPERVRVQPRAGEEIVIERIATTEDDGGEHLPSLLGPDGDESSRIVVSARAFEDRVRVACGSRRPLLIFDQFEEIVTLFEDEDAVAVQRDIVGMLVRLLREPLAVKLLFVFREDYLSKVKHLLAAVPELVDQALRLQPLSAQALPTIIRGPFERHPGHFTRELDPELAQRLCAALEERFGSADLSLSEVETVALRLWESDDPQTLLAERGVQGILEDYLGEALDALPADVRAAAIALLAQMVTSAGTRNVISAEDLVQRVREEDPDLSPALLSEALERLESGSRLIRRERRRDTYLYEITSEFLVPWISQRREEARRVHERRRDELRREQERARERRRLRVLGSIAGALLVVAAVVAILAVWALHQRDVAQQARTEAQRQASNATSLALTSSAATQLSTRPDLSLLLAFAAYRERPRAEARSAVLAGLTAARGSEALRAILRGHSDGVIGVVFSPDGRTLASASDDRTVRLWDARTHKQLGTPLRGKESFLDVAFSPDGRTLASSGDDQTIRLWDARTHKQLGTPLRGHEDPVNSVAFSPDGRTLASASDDGTVRFWNTRTHKQLGTPLRGHRGLVVDVAFSPDGHTVASAGSDRTIRLWDTRTHKQLGTPLRGHADWVRGVAFSPDGRTLASAGDDTTIRLWDTHTHEQRGTALRGHADWVRGVAFSPDGRTLASASDDRTVRLWDARTHEHLGPPLRGTGPFLDVVFSPDGRTLASISSDQTIRLWDTRAHRLGTTLRGHADWVRSVAFAPDGRTLASSSSDLTVRLWDARTHKHLGPPLRGHDGLVLDVAFSPDGRVLASGSADHTVRLWDARTHKHLGPPLRGHGDWVNSVTFSPDGRTLASAGDDRTVRFWDARTHKQRGTPLRGKDPFLDVAFSPDGRTLASGGDDHTIRLWDARTHKQRGTPLRGHEDPVNSVAFSPDGRTLASGSDDRTIRFWDAGTHKQLGAAVRGHSGLVVELAFSPDGDTLASASSDQTIRLWDARTHKQLGTPLRGHRDWVRGVAFSPDGRTLASASDDTTIRLWANILWRNIHELQTEVCSLVGSGLSRTEWAQYATGIRYRQTCP